MSYIVQAREVKRSNWYQVDIVESNETKLKISDLVQSNSYYFRVLAKNSVGISPALETDQPISIIRPPGIPDTPIPLLVSEIHADGCTLEWNAPTWTGGEELLGYLIEMRIGDPNSSQWTNVCDIQADFKTYKVKNLQENREYYFRISAYNKIGTSKPLELNRPVIPKKDSSVPMPPTGPISTLTCNKESICIQWGPPKDDGGSPLKRYIIYSREVNKQNWIRVGITNADNFSYQIENLTENSQYHFRVFAENDIGKSSYLQTEEPIKVLSKYNVPDKPEGPIIISNVNSSSALVSWKKPLNDGGSPIIGYLVKRRDIERPVWVKCGRVTADTYRTVVKDLAEGCRYTIQIFAENSEGLSLPLELEEPIQPKRNLQPPFPPSSFECIGVDKENVTLQWESPLDDGGAPIKNYILEMCDSTKRYDNSKWIAIKNDIPSIETCFCVNNLTEGNKYMFRLCAQNEIGISEPKSLDKHVSPRKMIIPPPNPIGPIKIMNIDENSVTIGWQHPLEKIESISKYIIEIRDVLKANWTTVATINSKNDHYKISDLNENNEYYIRIRSQNDANISSLPLETENPIIISSPYTVPSSPKDLKVIAIKNNKVTIQFIGSEFDGGLPIKNYIIEKRDKNRYTWVKAIRIKAKEDDDKSSVYTCDIDDLNQGSTYMFRAFSENSKGKSQSCEIKNPVLVEKETEKPSRPLDLNIISNKKTNSLMLGWRAPLYDGNESILEYIVEMWNSNQNNWSVISNCDVTSTQFLVNNLKEGLSYKFRVFASNKIGKSDPSLETAEFKISKKKSEPDTPLGPLKYSISDDQSRIFLNWLPPKSDGGCRIKRYIVEKKIVSGFQNEWHKIGFSSSDETSFRVTDYSIEDSTVNFRILAENDVGKSMPLELNNPIQIIRKKTIPKKPLFVKIKEKSTEHISLTWKSISLSSNSESEKFLVERRVNGSDDWIKVGITSSESISIYDLDPLLSYFFRVKAINEAGESEPAELEELVTMNISTEVPSIPLSVSVDVITQNSVTISWISPKKSGSGPILGYKIFKMANIYSHWQEVETIAKSKILSYKINDLDYNIQYKFKLCAYNNIGMGECIETEQVKLKKPIGKLFIFK